MNTPWVDRVIEVRASVPAAEFSVERLGVGSMLPPMCSGDDAHGYLVVAMEPPVRPNTDPYTLVLRRIRNTDPDMTS